jgi:tight adherence protein B
MLLLVILLVAAATVLLSLALFPHVAQLMQKWQKKQEQIVGEKLEESFSDKNPRQIARLYFILPAILGLAGFLLLRSLLLAFAGVALGLFIPHLILRVREIRRKQKFNLQILDAIMILSTSLKGGLSLLQSLEVLAEEMPAPMSQEIGLVVRENKMGVLLEDSLGNLSKRMNIEELSLLVNSILVARETGGDLTKVFSRIATTIRDNRKLKDNIKTLTMQGRMQGMIMSVLPFLFIIWVLSFNRHHFDIMLQSDIGRMLLFIAAALQAIGMILIRKFSSLRI